MMTTTIHAGDPIGLLFGGPLPTRFVWSGERWTVTEAEPGDIDYLPTHGSVVSGWHLTAQTEAGDDVARFEIRREGAGWIVESASYA